MPKRTDIRSIMIIGAGPIVIGQACEFDYSGAQACKALREEGYRVILVNSNPATIMTDRVWPTPPISSRSPRSRRQDHREGAPRRAVADHGRADRAEHLAGAGRHGGVGQVRVELIGANREAIEMAEDRKLFREAMDRSGWKTRPRSSPREEGRRPYDINAGVREAIEAIEYVGLPAIIRPAFTLGGTGGGVAYNRDDSRIVRSGLDASPVAQVLIDESLLGWKEYEMEVVRDKADNAIIVCSIENVDPMGVHTGDSITVAPALTLTDKEYQIMRNGSSPSCARSGSRPAARTCNGRSTPPTAAWS
jgi:carbamoyl-phosphate synthase large subunit